MKVVISSGYFNPIHSGHIEYLKKASELADLHFVILNNDEQAINKKGKIIIPIQDRLKILEAIRYVNKVFIAIDTDETVCATLKMIAEEVRDTVKSAEIIFAKGGDRFSNNIPEMTVCKEFDIKMVDGLGNKIQSSSSLIENIQK